MILSLVNLADMFANWVSNLQELWEFLTKPNFANLFYQELYDVDNPISHTILSSHLFNKFNFFSQFGDASLLEIILGTSIVFFIIYTLVKWILDIIL